MEEHKCITCGGKARYRYTVDAEDAIYVCKDGLDCILRKNYWEKLACNHVCRKCGEEDLVSD